MPQKWFSFLDEVTFVNWYLAWKQVQLQDCFKDFGWFWCFGPWILATPLTKATQAGNQDWAVQAATPVQKSLPRNRRPKEKGRLCLVFWVFWMGTLNSHVTVDGRKFSITFDLDIYQLVTWCKISSINSIKTFLFAWLGDGYPLFICRWRNARSCVSFASWMLHEKRRNWGKLLSGF